MKLLNLRKQPKDRKELYMRALLLALPMMIQNGITNAVGLVDNMMVGKLGTESMTGVSICGQLIFVFNLAIFGAISGPGIFGAQFFGNKDTEGVRKAFRIKVWAVLLCVALGLALFIFDDKLLIGLYMKGESATLDPVLTMERAREYLHIMLVSFLPFGLTQVYASSLRENNESMMPMIAGVISVITDVVLNYILIFGKFGLPALGVEGAAIATVIARFVELAVLVSWAHKRRHRFPFLQGVYKTLLVEKEVLIPIIRKSIPIFFNEFFWAAGIAALTTLYATRGLAVVPAVGISNALTNLLNVVFVAMGSAVGIVIGQMLGAGETKDIKKKALSLMWFTATMSFGLSLILALVAPFFPRPYETTEEVKNMATVFILITACFFPIWGFLNSQYFIIRAGGKTVVTFIMDSGFTWAVCVLTVFCITHFTNLPIFVVYTISLSLDILKVMFGLFIFFKGVWITSLARKKVE
jgi:putative MATE family efflux protein